MTAVINECNLELISEAEVITVAHLRIIYVRTSCVKATECSDNICIMVDTILIIITVI